MKKTRRYKKPNARRTKKHKMDFDNLDLYLPKELAQILNLYPPIINNTDIISALNLFTVTKVPMAHKYIINAMIQLYGFNQMEACNNFLMAALYDKNCAFAYWGASYSLQLNINHIIISKKLLKFSVSCLKKAMTLQSHNDTPIIVKDLIDALYKRTVVPKHHIDSPTNIKPTYTQIETLMINYNESMKPLYQKYGKDENIAVLYAASIMTIHPWHWWPQGSIYDTNLRPQIKARPKIKSAYHVLSEVLQHSPHHLGALHYFVHLVEESPHPNIALFAVNNLKKLTTNVPLGHLVHMPAHIYTRLGSYMDSITANMNAIKADDKYLRYKTKATKQKLINSYYVIEYMAHNPHFLIVDSQRMGNIGYCKKYLPVLENHVHNYIDIKAEKNVFLEHFLTVKCQVYLRFGMYKDIINQPRPAPFYLLWIAIDSYTRVVSYCKLGNLEAAHSELIVFKAANSKFIKEAPKETCRCGCSKRHGGICNPNYGLNKYTYFRKHNISYDSNDSKEQSCCPGTLREESYRSPKPGGIRSPTTFAKKLDDPRVTTPPSLLLEVSGTLTVNNTLLLAKIRESLSSGYLEWYFGLKVSALAYFKKATEQYEDLQYDEPSAYQSDVHHVYASALYLKGQYHEALYIIERGEIPHPNQLNAAFIKKLIFEKIGNKKEIKNSKKKYAELLKLADYTPNLQHF